MSISAWQGTVGVRKVNFHGDPEQLGNLRGEGWGVGVGGFIGKHLLVVPRQARVGNQEREGVLMRPEAHSSYWCRRLGAQC